MVVPETDNIFSSLFKRAFRESLFSKDVKSSRYGGNGVEKTVKNGLKTLLTAIEQGKKY